MTTLTRTIRRKVTTLFGAELVVTLAPDGIWLREPRRRTGYLLPYGRAFQQAAQLEADRQRREKVAARKARVAARRGGR